MADKVFDILIIGGGPGGYVAAIRAAQLGLKTGLIESTHLGGICLNWGCIPTKALLRSAEIYDLMRYADEFGFKINKIEVDFKKVIERSRTVAGTLNQGVSFLLKKNKVTVIEGHGKLAGSGKVSVTDKDGKEKTVSAKHILLATGARARSLPGLEADGKDIWTYKEAMVPDKCPASVLVVGSGAIGIEFASFYANMGAQVTVVEVLPRILPVEDAEISAFLQSALEARGMNFLTNAKVAGIKKGKAGLKISVEADGKTKTIEAQKVIMAVGITGNVENLGLEGTKVKVDRGHVVTDEWSRTGEKGVYAIGDLTGPPWLAHKASHEGVICIEKIAGLPHVHPLDTGNIPGCTYCSPQVASVGLTEEAAEKKGHKVRVGRFPYVGNGKAIALGETEGLIKTVFDDVTGELLGAHMVGAEVTELIQGFAIARTLETTEEQLMATVFPHPTLSEMMHESVLDAFGRAIHI